MSKVRVIQDTNEEYHASELLGTSVIASGFEPNGQINLAKVKAYIDGSKVISKQLQKAFDIGTVMHSAILEQDISGVVELPEFKPIPAITKKSQEEEWLNSGKSKADMPKFSPISGVTLKEQLESFKRNNPAKFYLKKDEFEMVVRSFDVVASSDVVSRIISNALNVETSFYDDESGIKVRPDVIGQNDNGGLYICNYKSIAELTKAKSQIFFKNYDIRAAQEIKVVEKALGKKVDQYIFLFQEKSAPHCVRFIELSEEDKVAALREQIRCENSVKLAIKDNYFPHPELVFEVSSLNRQEKDLFDEVAS